MGNPVASSLRKTTLDPNDAPSLYLLFTSVFLKNCIQINWFSQQLLFDNIARILLPKVSNEKIIKAILFYY